MLPLWYQIIVFTAEGNNEYIRLVARHAADAIAMETSTVDDMARDEGSACGLHNRFCSARKTDYFRVRAYNPALRNNELYIFFTHDDVVGYACGRDQQRAQTSGVRLELVQFFQAEQLQTCDPVCPPALRQLFKS